MVSKIPYFSIATIGWFIALLLGTLTPASDLPEVDFSINDKLVHLVIFLVLSILLLIAIKREGFLRITKSNVFIVVLLIASAIAVSTEVLQHFIPGRQMDLYDLIANETGVIIGLLILRPVYKG